MMDGSGTKSNGPVVQGFLNRRIMGGNMKSKKKWFVLTGRRLQSFKSEQDFINGNVFIDCIDLMELQSTRALASQGHAKNAFEIVTRNKSLVFQATSPEKSAEWLTALKRAMMLRFSESTDLPEEKEETMKIESELQRRKSTMKFWRNSRTASSHRSEEDDVMNSFDFLANQEADVFDEVDETQNPADTPVHVRPISESSGVGSASVEESSDCSVPTIHIRELNSEDEGIGETTEEPPSDESTEEPPLDDETTDETLDPVYQNIQTYEISRKMSTPAIDELKELVHFEEKMNEKENGKIEFKGIEELRELLASMP